MPLEVVPYSLKTLVQLFETAAREVSGKVAPGLSQKQHFEYLGGYLETIGSRTIVVEDRYIDRDYLEDFADYYVRCFSGYSKSCYRLHFFSSSFNQVAFDALVRGVDQTMSIAELQGSYLGFIVAKPLPLTSVGRTCLVTYPTEGTRRFPATRIYHANLCGVELGVRSLAFQEQDSVVAACATSALWSSFHATGMKFQHPIPSPVQITKVASANSPTQQRTIPNVDGLTPTAMAQAIRHVGLEPYCVSVEADPNHFLLRSVAKSYVQGGIPSLLIIQLVRKDGDHWTWFGNHAVTISGYNIGTHTTPFGPTNFVSSASGIDKFYVHDDQVGPFARMDLDGQQINVKYPGRDAVIACGSLSTQWRVLGQVRAVPIFLLVPVYHKIRITFSEIRDLMVNFDASLKGLIQATRNELSGDLVWDIHLQSVNEFKGSVLASTELLPEKRHILLTMSLPRFIWRASGKINGHPVLELIFDATDISQGSFALAVIEYDEDLGKLIRGAISDPTVRTNLTQEVLWRVLSAFS